MEYALVKIGSPIEVINRFTGAIPSNLIWPDGDATCGGSVGMSHTTYMPGEGENDPPVALDTYRLLEVIDDQDGTRPTSLHVHSDHTYAIDGDTLVVTPVFVEPPLNEMIITARDRINEWKSKMQGSGFTFNGVEYDSDNKSRDAINGAVTMALIAMQAQAPYSVTWTASDNSQVAMDGPTMTAFGVAAGQSFIEWHVLASDAKERITNLPTPITAASIEAILVELGA